MIVFIIHGILGAVPDSVASCSQVQGRLPEYVQRLVTSASHSLIRKCFHATPFVDSHKVRLKGGKKLAGETQSFK